MVWTTGDLTSIHTSTQDRAVLHTNTLLGRVCPPATVTPPPRPSTCTLLCDPDHAGRVYVCTMGRLLAAAVVQPDASCIIIWDPPATRCTRRFPHILQCMTASPQKVLAAGADDGTLIVWNPTNDDHAPIQFLPDRPHAASIVGVAWLPDGGLASVGSDGYVSLWPPPDLSAAHLQPPTGTWAPAGKRPLLPTTCLLVHAPTPHLLVGTVQGGVLQCPLEVDAGAVDFPVQHTGPVLALRVCPDCPEVCMCT